MVDIKISNPNVFFNQKVFNRDLIIDNQTVLSFGYMEKGTYKWQAEKTESFTISCGQISVSINDGPRNDFAVGESFTVQAGEIFELSVIAPLHYEVKYS